YNVLVFNQNLKNNSSATIINTNVLRDGAAYDANVLGAELSLNNKKNTYSFGTSGAFSSKIYPGSNYNGHTWAASFGKTAGNFNWRLGYAEESDTYDPNDLGFLYNNNSREVFGNLSLARYEDFGNFNEGRISIFSNYSRLYAPDAFQRWRVNVHTFLQTKKFFTFGFFGNVSPLRSYDYFEPRTEDFSRYVNFPAFGSGGFFVSTDYRKKVATDLEVYFGGNKELGGRYVGFSVFPRFQLNDKLIIRPRMGLDLSRNDPGYVTTTDEDIIFGYRAQNVWVTSLNLSYIFGPRMSLNLNGRHYWAGVTYTDFWSLGEDGLFKETDYDEFNDINFNAFNIDTVFRWRFAPGSDIFFVWKNSIFSDDKIPVPSWGENYDIIGNSPTRNSLSIKVIYFLDYLSLTKSS
ncbi:MAG: hypothetical protein HKN16_11195, partial [Saprospiraceae bacterium]|nr:hypothetical protein [Saprospiraceae bacterium]